PCPPLFRSCSSSPPSTSCEAPAPSRSRFRHLSTLAEAGDIIAVMAVEDRRTRAPRSSVGYAIVLLGAALFVATCFLPYYGYEFAQGGTVSLYDQLIVAYGGGLQLGPKLFLFGGVATVVVVALVGLTRRERPLGRAFLAGAVTVWSLTWIGSLLQSASLRGGGTIRGLTLEIGFWLQAVSISVAIIGTILVGTRRNGGHRRGGAGPAAGRRAPTRKKKPPNGSALCLVRR